METGRVRIGSIVIDCTDFRRMLAFWQEALHYVPKYPPEDGWVILKDPDGRGPNVSLNQTSEGPLDQYRLHLDLYTEDQAGDVVATHPPGRNPSSIPRAGRRFRSSRGPGWQPVLRGQHEAVIE